MSQWTHVNASIRFDGIPSITGEPITPEELGKMCLWGDEDTSHWDNSFIPCGSEGSLSYQILKTGTESSLACRVVVFTGDLRSYSAAEEILAYFEKIVKGRMIRSGILEIAIEGQYVYIYRHDRAKDKWILSSTTLQSYHD